MGWREQMKSAAGSVGIVSPQRFQSVAPLVLQNGSVLDTYELVYETYGELNGEKSNALLICHALSGHHHAAGLHQEDDANQAGGTPVSARARPSTQMLSSS